MARPRALVVGLVVLLAGSALAKSSSKDDKMAVAQGRRPARKNLRSGSAKTKKGQLMAKDDPLYALTDDSFVSSARAGAEEYAVRAHEHIELAPGHESTRLGGKLMDGLKSNSPRFVIEPLLHDFVSGLVRHAEPDESSPSHDALKRASANFLAAHDKGESHQVLMGHALLGGSELVHEAVGRHVTFGYMHLDDDTAINAFNGFRDYGPEELASTPVVRTPIPTPKPVTPAPTPKVTPAPTPKITPAPTPLPSSTRTAQPSGQPTEGPSASAECPNDIVALDAEQCSAVQPDLDILCSSEVLPDGNYCVGDDVCFLEDQGACNVASLLPGLRMLLDTTTNGVYVVGGVPTAVPAPLPTPVPAPAPTGLPLPAPTAVPTCVEIIESTVNDFGGEDVVIDEDDCKLWKVITNLTSLTVNSSSASEEVEDVDVTFSDAGGVSDFLAVGESGNAKATTIAAEGDIDGGVRVAARNGELGGNASGTSIIVHGTIGSAPVPGLQYVSASVLVGYGSGSNADDTNIVADSMSRVFVGYQSGTATNTNVAVAGSVRNVNVGRDGEATNTNITAGSVDEVYVGTFSGEAFNTTIAAGDVTSDLRVGYAPGGKATDTNIAVNGFVSKVTVGEGGKAIDTNIAADSVTSNVIVGYEGGEATDTNIAVDGDVNGNVRVGYDSGEATDTNIAVNGSVSVVSAGFDDGTATNTTIAVNGSASTVYVGALSGTAFNTTIAADSVSGSVNVGSYDDGEATNTNIEVADSVGFVYVGLYSGTAINTHITAGSVGDVNVGQDGTANNTNITLANGGGTITVYGPGSNFFGAWEGATNTNIVNNNVTNPVTIKVDGTPTGTTCNGVPISGDVDC